MDKPIRKNKRQRSVKIEGQRKPKRQKKISVKKEGVSAPPMSPSPPVSDLSPPLALPALERDPDEEVTHVNKRKRPQKKTKQKKKPKTGGNIMSFFSKKQ